MSQYNEPWAYSDGHDGYTMLHRANPRMFRGSVVTEDRILDWEEWIDERYGQRLVRCVNACAGIPDEVLDQNDNGAILAMIQELKSQNLEALKKRLKLTQSTCDTLNELVVMMTKKIEEMEGVSNAD